MYKKQHKIIFIFSLIFFLAFLVFPGIQKDSVFVQPVLEIANQSEVQVPNISVTVITDDVSFNFSLDEGNSLYEVLYEARENNQITFSGRKYFGLGFFVTDIGSLHQAKGKNLLYYINDEKAKTGISSYIPQDGDIISWKLE